MTNSIRAVPFYRYNKNTLKPRFQGNEEPDAKGLPAVWNWLGGNNGSAIANLLAMIQPFGLKINLKERSIIDRDGQKLDQIITGQEELKKHIDTSFDEMRALLRGHFMDIHQNLITVQHSVNKLRDAPLYSALVQFDFGIEVLSDTRKDKSFALHKINLAQEEACRASYTTSSPECKFIAFLIQGMSEVLLGFPDRGFRTIYEGYQHRFGPISSRQYVEFAQALTKRGKSEHSDFFHNLGIMAANEEDLRRTQWPSENSLNALVAYWSFLKSQSRHKDAKLMEFSIKNMVPIESIENRSDLRALSRKFHDFGHVFTSSQDHESALTLYEIALELARCVYGAKSDIVNEYRRSVVSALNSLGRHKEANERS